MPASAAAHSFLGSLALLSLRPGQGRGALRAGRGADTPTRRAPLGLAEVRLRRATASGARPGSVKADELQAAAADFAAITPADTDPKGTAVKAALGQARALRCLSQAGVSDHYADGRGAAGHGRRRRRPRSAQQEWLAVAHAELALIHAPAVGGQKDQAALEQALAETKLAIDTTKRRPEQGRVPVAGRLLPRAARPPG